MILKVLKKRRPTKWVYEATCNGFGHENVGCRSLLEIKRSDLTIVEVSKCEPNELPKSLHFTCPVCKRKTDIGMSYWPKTLVGIEVTEQG